MRRAFIALLLAGAFYLVLLVRTQAADLKRMAERQAFLSKQAEIKSGVEVQSKCADQAEKVFRDGGWEKKPSADFTDHFNFSLGKCMMNIRNLEMLNGNPMQQQILEDAFEGKVYGNFIWSNPDGKKYWEVVPLECDVTSLSGEKKVCHSSDEYDALLKSFME